MCSGRGRTGHSYEHVDGGEKEKETMASLQIGSGITAQDQGKVRPILNTANRGRVTVIVSNVKSFLYFVVSFILCHIRHQTLAVMLAILF